MTDLEEAAAAAGATQLGEEGPDGAHWIFSGKEMEAFARLVRGETGAKRVLLLPPCPLLPPLPY